MAVFVPALLPDHNYNCHPKTGDHCAILVPLEAFATCLIGHCISNLKSQQIRLAESHRAKKLKAAVFRKGSLKRVWKNVNSL